jgi:hypothetical protein
VSLLQGIGGLLIIAGIIILQLWNAPAKNQASEAVS